jgi:hypothetical protein
VFIKKWSVPVRQAVRRRFRKKKLCKNCLETWRMRNVHSSLC